MEFIKRTSDKLYNGDKEFRFISFNIPDAMYSSHKGIPTGFMTSAYEQEDLIKGLSDMGCTVARLYCMSIPGEGVGIPAWNCFIKKPGEYNEDYFLGFDKLIQLSSQYGVRLIFPFVDRYKFIGGVGDFAAQRGKHDDPFSDDFYSDKDVISDFKQVISDVLNRTNVFTGIKYKDDPTIMAWETGNELWHETLYDEWAREICAHIKSLDKNHLVLDGFFGVRKDALDDVNIDIVSSHFYPAFAPDFVAELNKWYNMSKGIKPFIVGEFGFLKTKEVEIFLDRVIDSGVTGALVWSMRQHSIYGGIRHHRETEIYCTYHYPGFEEHSAYEEKELVALISKKSLEINGEIPRNHYPLPPMLLPIKESCNIRFLGSCGAESYIVERMTDINIGFEEIARDIVDCAPEGEPVFGDSLFKGIRYYRVRAVNKAGVSAPSNIEKYAD